MTRRHVLAARLAGSFVSHVIHTILLHTKKCTCHTCGGPRVPTLPPLAILYTDTEQHGERRRVRPRYLTKPASFSGQSFAATRACTDSTPTLPKWLLSVLTWWWRQACSVLS